jgi:hypothetical protein
VQIFGPQIDGQTTQSGCQNGEKRGELCDDQKLLLAAD